MSFRLGVLGSVTLVSLMSTVVLGDPLQPASTAAFGCVRTVAEVSYGRSTAVAVSPAATAITAGRVVLFLAAAPAAQPVVISELRLGFAPYHLAWSNEYLIADSVVLDVHDPAAPSVVGQLPFDGEIHDLEAAGSTVWVAGQISWNRVGALVAFDLTVPGEPIELGRIETPGQADAVAVRDGVAYVADGTRGLRVILASDPYRMAELAAVETGHVNRVELGEGVVFLSSHLSEPPTHSRLLALDVTAPSNPSVMAVLQLDHPAYASDMAYSHGLLFLGLTSLDPSVSLPGGGLAAIDLAFGALTEVAYLPFDGGAAGVDQSGDYLYLADPEQGLRLVDLAQPSAPRFVAGYDVTVDEVFGVAAGGGFAFLADHGLSVIDLGSAGYPRLVGRVDGPESSSVVAVDNGLAAVLDDGGGVQLIDVEAPSAPVQLAHIEASDTGRAISLGNGLLVFADGSDELLLFDLGDFALPRLVGHIALAGDVTAVRSVDALVLAGLTVGEAGEIAVIDVSDPRAPQQIGFLSTPLPVLDLAASRDRVVTLHQDGLRVVDTSQPQTPVELGATDSGLCCAVDFDEDAAYIVSWPGSIKVIGLDDPTSPDAAGSLVWQGQITDIGPLGGRDVASYEGRVMVADAMFGLRILDPRTCLLGPVRPPGSGDVVD